jgi:nitrate/nitrite transporter NarK
METVGVGILVTTATGKAGWTGLVAAAGFVPTALLAPLGGALADRMPRRTLLLATTAFQIAFSPISSRATTSRARSRCPPRSGTSDASSDPHWRDW